MNSLCGQAIFNLDDPDEKAIIKFWKALNEANRKTLIKHLAEHYHNPICKEIKNLNKAWCEFLR